MAEENELPLEERVKLLEEKIEYLWAGNPPHVRPKKEEKAD